jgi:hypothetical protein
MSENLNINNDIMENFEKSIDQKILFSESREELKSIISGRNLKVLNDENNSFFNYKQNKYKKKTKKIDNLNKNNNNNIRISATRLNNINYNKYSNNNHKKNSKDKILVFYNKQLPLLLKRSNNTNNRLKPNNLDKSKSKKISNTKINNKYESCSTEIYSKDSNNGYEKNYINHTNNDLLVKNKTVKELFDINNNKKYDNVIKIITNRPKKINMIKQNLLREMKNNKSGMKQNNKKKEYLKSNSISKNKLNKKKEMNKSKSKNNINISNNNNDNIKIILKYILNENLKYDYNKNMIILNRASISKNKENESKTTHIQKNTKSISRKNILLSPAVTKENNKKMNLQRNNKNKTYFIQNNFDIKMQNNINNLIKNTNTSFPNLRRSVKNDNNTGYKIKNLNINYFNIIPPNELFFIPKSSRSNSKRQKNNKNKFIIFNNNNNINNSSNFIFESKINNTLI